MQEEPLTRSKSNDTESPAVGSLCTKGDVRGTIETKHSSTPGITTRKQSRGDEPNLSQSALATVDNGTPKDICRTPVMNGVPRAYCPDGCTGDGLSGVDKASRFGNQTLMGRQKCQVFEVVLQQKETTICPSCARSPRRAALPAHSRGCFGLS